MLTPQESKILDGAQKFIISDMLRRFSPYDWVRGPLSKFMYKIVGPMFSVYMNNSKLLYMQRHLLYLIGD